MKNMLVLLESTKDIMNDSHGMNKHNNLISYYNFPIKYHINNIMYSLKRIYNQIHKLYNIHTDYFMQKCSIRVWEE